MSSWAPRHLGRNSGPCKFSYRRLYDESNLALLPINNSTCIIANQSTFVKAFSKEKIKIAKYFQAKLSAPNRHNKSLIIIEKENVARNKKR